MMGILQIWALNPGAWTAVVLDMLVRMMLAFARFHSGQWKEVIDAAEYC